jgi:arylsulfatase A-like enzyme
LENTLIVLTSDNGPVLNDGYYDDAVEKNGAHTSAGPLRGGKYSLFEAGTRVPFITYWEGKIEPKVSDAMVCQMDLLSSIAALVETSASSVDGQDLLSAFMGTSDQGREELVIEATSRTALREGDWIMIPPYPGRKINTQVNIELGNDGEYQLYNLKDDLGQQTNLAQANPEKLAAMKETFETIRGVQTGETEVLKLE